MDFSSGDVTIINICGNWGELTIYNIYNDCKKNDTVHKLEAFSRLHANPSNHANNSNKGTKSTIWLGDFNRHHLHWDDPTNTRLFTSTAIQDAEILISVVAELGLDLALPPGIPTHLHNVTKKWTRLNHVFIWEDHMDTIIICKVLEDTLGINTDHLSILTTLDLNLSRAPNCPPRNFRNIDWEEFEKELVNKLDGLPQPSIIRSAGELNDACRKLTSAIQEAISMKYLQQA